MNSYAPNPERLDLCQNPGELGQWDFRGRHATPRTLACLNAWRVARRRGAGRRGRVLALRYAAPKPFCPSTLWRPARGPLTGRSRCSGGSGGSRRAGWLLRLAARRPAAMLRQRTAKPAGPARQSVSQPGTDVEVGRSVSPRAAAVCACRVERDATHRVPSSYRWRNIPCNSDPRAAALSGATRLARPPQDRRVLQAQCARALCC